MMPGPSLYIDLLRQNASAPNDIFNLMTTQARVSMRDLDVLIANYEKDFIK